MLSIGVFGTSAKKDEKRVPLHPGHFSDIPETLRNHMYFEQGYGLRFGLSDEELSGQCGGVMDRSSLFSKCDIALLAKPTLKDFEDMADGTIHWGWPHCVQQQAITQVAIDKKLTLIAWEAMHSWSADGNWQGHTFQKNNEIAGYAAVQHAMNLIGIDGHYGPQRKAVVLGYGSVAQGAIKALQLRGVSKITVLAHRDQPLPKDRPDNLKFYSFSQDTDNTLKVSNGMDTQSIIEFLTKADIIVNGVLQDTNNPWMFVGEDETQLLKHGILIIDVSCDEGMGFAFARPTSFAAPIFRAGPATYYAVDHTPSYLWQAASWEISKSVVAYLDTVMRGEESWENDQTIKRAIEIKNGVIVNEKILSFQNRADIYPHDVM